MCRVTQVIVSLVVSLVISWNHAKYNDNANGTDDYASLSFNNLLFQYAA